MIVIRASRRATAFTFLAASNLFGQVAKCFQPSINFCPHIFIVSNPVLKISHHGAFVSRLRMSSSNSEEVAPKKRVLVPIGDASEEIETSCITDTLTRFGAEVVVASVMPREDLICTMSRGLKFVADTSIDQAAKEEWDLIALPGGMPGAEHLRDCDVLIDMLKKQKQSNKLYAAVCASPSVVLASKELLGDKATCYPAPGLRASMPNASEEAVVIDNNLITSQGPGTSLKFALALGEQLYGKSEADKIAEEMLVDR